MSLCEEHQAMSPIHHSLPASSHLRGNPARHSRAATIGWDAGAGSEDVVRATAASLSSKK